jgi:ubiquinone/menaquinone biosynthesis C-methylase UbiE
MTSPAATPKRCFTRDYELGRSPLVRELERNVLGCDYGATSWTTRDEAGMVADLLGLRAGVRLLDVGAGAGWPGLYLAQISGCDVVLTDVPHVGVRLALERAARDGIGERCRAVVSDGAALPFADNSFDAISHSDVLCCMAAKLELLRECRRVARAGAPTVFSVIAPAPALSEGDRRLAIESGPEFVDVDGDYPTLLEQSDWRVSQQIDVTDVFAQSIRTSLRLMSMRKDSLIETLGAEDYRERMNRRQATLAGLDRGVLKRQIFVATASRTVIV